MAIFKQFTYTNNGTEIDFMQGLVDLICGLDDSITVEDANGNPTTVAEQYADLSTTPDFFLNLGNGVKMEFKRPRASSSGTSDYLVNNGYVSWGSNYYTMQAGTRSYFIAYLKSDNFAVLWLGTYAVTTISSASISFLLLKTASDRFVNMQRNINVLNYALTGNNSSVTFSPMFSYSAGAGNIDFAEKAIFISGGARALETEEIKSCSTMPQFSSIALPDGRNFFTIATNAMVEVDAEEA